MPCSGGFYSHSSYKRTSSPVRGRRPCRLPGLILLGNCGIIWENQKKRGVFMKLKRILPAILVFALVLSGCFCGHKQWLEADCVTPKTCAKCGETEGEALGHDFLDAACLTPKTCAACGETEGDALGHNWLDAACLIPKTCEACGLTEGEALGHDWLDATTEAPATCARCGETEGEPIITDPRFTTAANQALFGVWEGVLTVPADSLNMGLGGIGAMIDLSYRVEFFPDGTMTVIRRPVDNDQFVHVMVAVEVEKVYGLFEWDYYTRAEADAAIRKTYDMTMEEYVAMQMGPVDVDALFADRVEEYVYYLEGETLYRAGSWSGKMTANACTPEIGCLTLSLDGGEAGVFTNAE